MARLQGKEGTVPRQRPFSTGAALSREEVVVEQQEQQKQLREYLLKSSSRFKPKPSHCLSYRIRIRRLYRDPRGGRSAAVSSLALAASCLCRGYLHNHFLRVQGDGEVVYMFVVANTKTQVKQQTVATSFPVQTRPCSFKVSARWLLTGTRDGTS
ncbi:hypothetical protein KCU71_g142, partial [Aureobasidium melanogenum]